jgi:HD-GYP domain-containing protein (c-di-GMP phosphodiesterase class II)
MMRFRTRAFLLCFVPFTLLMGGSFWAVQKLVQSTVREGLRQSLLENQRSIALLRSRGDLQDSRFLRVVGENASLKAGIQLLRSYPDNSEGRSTVEDQLRELCEQMGFDFMLISDPNGVPLAEVLRMGGEVKPTDRSLKRPPRRGLMAFGNAVYQIASMPVDQGQENLGELSVGERFDLSNFGTPTLLMHDGRVILTSLTGVPIPEIQAALHGCRREVECAVRLGRAGYFSILLQGVALGDGFDLRSLQNVDAAAHPVQSAVSRVFLLASIGVLIGALFFSALSSKNIVEPISALISHLQRSEGTGLLPEFPKELSSIREIRELTSGYNRAASAIRQARENLQNAYIEFVGSLASALDARDRYTAGHSHRVSELACATAVALGLAPAEVHDIRIGSLLHDIGKIGVPDQVLQKSTRLTDDEFAMIKRHPEIGRRILEGVHGFAPYLPAVELHHENWDGTGYPHGQTGHETPLAARIIHVSDAYDAMTTDRPYRRGMSHDQAFAILHEFAGKHFDPSVVDVFVSLSCHPVPSECLAEAAV